MTESHLLREDIEHVRRRPGMYVGGTDLWGIINYLVCPYNLLLSCNPSYIDTSLHEGTFKISSDANLGLKGQTGDVFPFGAFRNGPGRGFEGLVFTALSAQLSIITVINNQSYQLTFQRGQCVKDEMTPCSDALPSTTFSFVPDTQIFQNVNLSEVIFESYFNRICHLFPGVKFRFSSETKTTEYFSPNGLVDLFQSFSAPFQILHEPIHFHASQDNVKLELIFAFHSWKENWFIPFINHGRAVEGGSHETAFNRALAELHGVLQIPGKTNGVIAIMSIVYPEVVWEGCIKAKIGDKKLYTIAKKLIVDSVVSWVDEHPHVADQLTRLMPFQFPDFWYKS